MLMLDTKLDAAMQPMDSITTVDRIHQYTAEITKCVTKKNLKLGKLLHANLIKTAFIFNTYLSNHVINMYAKCGSIKSVYLAFDDLPMKNIHSWNTLITGYCKIGRFDQARDLFDLMPNRNLVSYNSMISGLTRHGFYKESIELFRKMRSFCNDLVLDEYTLVSIVGCCACLGELAFLRQVHGVAIVIGLKMNVISCNALIDAYGKCGEPDSSYDVFFGMRDKDVVSWSSMVAAYAQASRLEDACWLFNEMPEKNTVSWTTLIVGFSQNGQEIEALNLFEQMQKEGFTPSAFTFVGILSACADLALIDRGKQIHAHVTRKTSNSELYNVFVRNALLDMYCKCGDMRLARALFEAIPDKDVISWNSLITGYGHYGDGDETLNVFNNMLKANIRPNHVTFLGVLSACSHTGLVSEGLRLFDLMGDYGVSPRSDHYAILIDLLGRKNKLKEAMDLITRFPNELDHIGIWGAILGACRVHGYLDLAHKAGEALLELDPANAARYVMLSNVYAAANRWDDARGMRILLEEKGLQKDAAFSWIVVGNERHMFVAKDRFHCQIDEIHEIIHNLVDQMKQAGYTSQ